MNRAKLSIVKAIVFAISVFVCSPLPAAVTPGAAAKQPDILVLIDQPSQKTQDFTPLISEAASYKLGNLGLASQVVSTTRPEADSPLPMIKASGASAALVCRYQVEGGQLVVTLGWFDPQTSTSVVVQARGPMDLHLDGVILEAMDDILSKVQAQVSALSARRAALNIPATPPAPTLPPPGEPPRRSDRGRPSSMLHTAFFFPAGSPRLSRPALLATTSPSGTFLPSSQLSSWTPRSGPWVWGSTREWTILQR